MWERSTASPSIEADVLRPNSFQPLGESSWAASGRRIGAVHLAKHHGTKQEQNKQIGGEFCSYINIVLLNMSGYGKIGQSMTCTLIVCGLTPWKAYRVFASGLLDLERVAVEASRGEIEQTKKCEFRLVVSKKRSQTASENGNLQLTMKQRNEEAKLWELWLRPWCLRHHLVCHSEVTVNDGRLCCCWFWGSWQLDWGHQVAKRWWHYDHGKAETALGVARKRLKVKGIKQIVDSVTEPTCLQFVRQTLHNKKQQEYWRLSETRQKRQEQTMMVSFIAISYLCGPGINRWPFKSNHNHTPFWRRRERCFVFSLWSTQWQRRFASESSDV